YLQRRRRQQVERSFHQQLGIRARNQGVRRHFQIQTPEALMAEDIGHRLALAAALQTRLKQRQLIGIRLTLGPGPQIAARLVQRGRQQQLGVQPWRGRVGQISGIEQGFDAGHISLVARMQSGKYVPGLHPGYGSAASGTRSVGRAMRTAMTSSETQSPSAASWSAWYSASSGSITASTPPAMISLSEYRVRLMR